MSDNKKQDGFIMQAGILAIAGILSRIIGLLYNSPMVAILGEDGNGYYSTAFNAYAIILLVSSYSIPSAVSKVIAQRLAAREYRNAHRIFQCALIYVLAVGGIACLFVFFGAGLLVESNSVPVLRVFAPTIFLSGILGVLRGYFQAHKTMLQTSVSQILEQILNAAISIGMAYVLTRIAGDQDTTRRAIYGAAGGAIGTGAGVLIAMLFMWGVYGLNKKTIKKRLINDKTKNEESFRSIFKLILLVVTPFILSTCIYNVNTFLNQTVYTKIMIYNKGLTEVETATFLSVLNKALKISTIPIALSSAMSAALIPGISGAFSQGFYKESRQKVAKAIQTTMFISIPSAVGIGVLAQPILWVLYPQRATIDLTTSMLILLAASVVFYALSTLSNAVLQGIGRVNSPVINALIALVIQTALLVPILLFTEMGIYAMAIATVAYSLMMCILNGFSVRRHLEYKQEWLKTFLLPFAASAVMGAAAYGAYQGIYFLCKINVVALAVAVVVAVIVYFVLVVKWRVVGEAELRAMPKGATLVRLMNKINPQRVRSTGNKKRNKKKKDGKRTSAKISKEKSKKAVEQTDDDYWLDE